MSALPPDSRPAASCPVCPGAEPQAQPARTRLLLAALKLFAAHGYDRTSIRAIAAEAQTNVAAVSYYFGDKAALHAALFADPFGSLAALVPDFSQPGLPLRTALQRFFQGALAPLHHGELAQQMVRLYLRQMLEPADQRQAVAEHDADVSARAIAALLQRHLKLPATNDDLQRLACAVSGLAHQVWCQHETLVAQQPQLLATPEALQLWAERLTDYALAMVAAERRRIRRRPVGPSTPAATP